MKINGVRCDICGNIAVRGYWNENEVIYSSKFISSGDVCSNCSRIIDSAIYQDFIDIDKILDERVKGSKLFDGN